MADTKHTFTSPVGRLIGGSVYEGKTTDYDGKPLVVKNGANAGQPRVDFSFGVAYPKTPGATHWAQEPWLAPLWALAHAAFPAGEAQRRDFSWKIIDGDSTEPNKKMKKPCDQEGHAGHWVVWFSSGQAPRLYNANGSELLTAPGAIKNGYYVQVCGNATDNKPSQSPGLYINHSMVALAGFGPEIVSGPDVASAGFGANVTLPAGASTVPVAALNTPAVPNVPGVPGIPSLANASPNVPVLGAPVSAAPVRVMTQKAAGYTYEQMTAPGSQWTDALLIQEGYMLAPVAMPAAPLPQVGSVPVPGVPAATVAVVPNVQFANIPGVPSVPAIPAVKPRVMTEKAGGMSFEQMTAPPSQWTEALLIQHGYMLQ